MVDLFFIMEQMTWYSLALISSFFLSLRELAFKRWGRNLPTVYMSWGLNGFVFLILTAVNLALGNTHPITLEFSGILLAAALMDTTAALLYLEAIRRGELSRTVPMLCFIPVVQLFVTPALVQEQLSWVGIAGVLLVVLGSYLLNIRDRRDPTAPLRQILEPGPTRMMLMVALIWGISSSFHKMGVQRTDALFWGLCEMGLITLFLFPFAAQKKGDWYAWENLKQPLKPALFSTVAVLTYYLAINQGPVAYVSALRRLGVLFSMGLGIWFLKEATGRGNLMGGAMMVAGAVVICLFG